MLGHRTQQTLPWADRVRAAFAPPPPTEPLALRPALTRVAWGVAASLAVGAATAAGVAAGTRQRHRRTGTNLLLDAYLADLPGRSGAGSRSAADLPEEHARPATRSGPLADLTGDLHASGRSAFTLLPGAEEALRWRLALVESAVDSLDVKYFIWKDDPVGHLLMARLLEAAARGVHVRLLVDDLNLVATDEQLAELDALATMEVRLFNPAPRRNTVGALLSYAEAFREMNRRMHNKMVVADGHAVVLGGRNIAAEYFGLSTKYNFLDLDVVAWGDVVPQVSDSFDVYWNSALAQPVSALAPRGASPWGAIRADVERMVEEERARVEGGATTLASYPTEPRDWSAELAEAAATWHVGDARYLQDEPVATGTESLRLTDMLEETADPSEEDLILVSGYLIPPQELLDQITEATADGVRVRVVTGTMGAVNHTAAYAHYRKYIPRILDTGAELYEIDAQPEHEVARAVNVPPVLEGPVAIHLKAMVADRRRCFLGSLNLDPRALVINTEGGLYVDSPGLAGELTDWLERLLSADNAWRVTADREGGLVWRRGEETRTSSPDRGGGHRVAGRFFQALPIESQL